MLALFLTQRREGLTLRGCETATTADDFQFESAQPKVFVAAM
jgi:hypothetical protein